MIVIAKRTEAECEDCFETKTVYETAINGTSKKLLCARCRDKKIDKWFDAHEKANDPQTAKTA